ncbi:MAG TPA: hypothetical protein VMP89_01110, partial [Solirubrobacteraceae bacterium]|nr:hypothetical protein [Solirubrobacteraceae bacterium]
MAEAGHGYAGLLARVRSLRTGVGRHGAAQADSSPAVPPLETQRDQLQAEQAPHGAARWLPADWAPTAAPAVSPPTGEDAASTVTANRWVPQEGDSRHVVVTLSPGRASGRVRRPGPRLTAAALASAAVVAAAVLVSIGWGGTASAPAHAVEAAVAPRSAPAAVVLRRSRGTHASAAAVARTPARVAQSVAHARSTAVASSFATRVGSAPAAS